MSDVHDEAVRVESIAVLDAIELAMRSFAEIFREVAAGTPLDPQRAETVGAQCEVLITNVTDTRNAIRLSAHPRGVH
jgi:hypothetical protein